MSDEKNCRTIYVDPEKYLKSKPPPSTETDSKLPIVLRFVETYKKKMRGERPSLFKIADPPL